ncbi:hypothetical protein SUDANB6_00034 [Streptomyces sp. enrichment culture]|uniref:transposase n=1 Tax=Streptomyces sp. enrichment culture TaxID=1795815 RepID=UPI003F5624EE
MVLVWNGLSAHRGRAMRAWVAEQDWLILERSPAYAPELNPVELLWSSLKKRELANLAGNHLADVADATGQGIHRIDTNPRLPWSFLADTGLTIRPPHPPNLRKDQYPHCVESVASIHVARRRLSPCSLVLHTGSARRAPSGSSSAPSAVRRRSFAL